jgi:hypothetical protein
VDLKRIAWQAHNSRMQSGSVTVGSTVSGTTTEAGKQADIYFGKSFLGTSTSIQLVFSNLRFGWWSFFGNPCGRHFTASAI